MKKFFVFLCVVSLLVSFCVFSASAAEILSAPEPDNLSGLAWLSNTKPLLGSEVSTLSLPAPGMGGGYNSSGFLTGFCYGQLGSSGLTSDFTQIYFRFLGPSWPSPSVIYSLGNLTSPTNLYISLFLGAFFHNFTSSPVDVSISYDTAYINRFKSSSSGISLSDTFVSNDVFYTVLVVSSSGDITNINSHSGNPSVPSSVSVPSGSTLLVCAQAGVSSPNSVDYSAIQASINSLSLVPSTLVSLSQFSLSSGSGLPVDFSGLSSSSGFLVYNWDYDRGNYSVPVDFRDLFCIMSRNQIWNPFYLSQILDFISSSNFNYFGLDNTWKSGSLSVAQSFTSYYLALIRDAINNLSSSSSSAFSSALSPVVSGLSSVSSAVSSSGSDIAAAVNQTTGAVQSNTAALVSSLQDGSKLLEDILEEVSKVPPMDQFESDYLQNFGSQLDTVEDMLGDGNKAFPNGGDTAGFLLDMSSGLLGNNSDVSMSDIQDGLSAVLSDPSSEESPWFFFSQDVADAMATQDAVGASEDDFDWENDLDAWIAELQRKDEALW